MKHLITSLLLVLLWGCTKDSPDPDHSANRKAVGASASDLLASDTFDKLVVEIQSMPGAEPTQQAIDHLKTFLDARLNKPGGITIVNSAVVSSGVSSYDFDRIKQIEEDFRTKYNEGTTIAMYFLFVDGDYSGNSGGTVTLGAAWRNTSMVIFQKSIQELSGGIGQPSRSVLESTVMDHEIGHLLGLVNVGSEMQTEHQDEPNGHHCDNSNCLMHYLAETGDIITTLLGGNIPQLDANCLDDLQANGGK